MFIVLTKTRLSDNFLNGKICLSNYVIYRCDRSSLTSNCYNDKLYYSYCTTYLNISRVRLGTAVCTILGTLHFFINIYYISTPKTYLICHFTPHNTLNRRGVLQQIGVGFQFELSACEQNERLGQFGLFVQPKTVYCIKVTNFT